jgi:hypothetical protein
MKSPFPKKLFKFTTERTKKSSNHARCNICDRVFRASTSFHRFCKSCRSQDELFKFAEWLPSA